MKKLLALLLVLILGMAALSGCSNKTATQTKKVYKIGIVQPMDHPSLNQIRETIIAEIKAQGMGDKVEIVTKNANGDMNLLPSIMQELINSNVDMIVPIATPAAQAAKGTTKTVPIVFSAVSNPVEAGLVTSFDATTGNITGVSNSIPIEDIFKLAATVTPNAKTFGFVYNSSEINSTSGIKKAKEYCDKNGIKYKEATITGTADVQQAASSLVGSIDAFFTPNDNTVASAMAVYVKVATDAKLPIYAGADSMVKDGALATVGIDYTKLGKQTAAMIIRIVNGGTIKDNHVEQVAEYANMINMGTANKLGITISDELKQKFVILGQ
ncbi:MAG: ABC transporter substrate-binding protein [Syntrophomonas sp.]